MKKITITASDGFHLSALLGTPQNTAQQSIIISSATAIKKEFYLNFAQFLVKKGYNVLLFDYRGIGESAHKDIKRAGSFLHEWGTLDMNAALNFMVHEMGFTDIVWLGHSIGGQLFGFLEDQQHIKKVISINAAVGYWRYFPYPMKIFFWFLWYVLSPILIKVSGYGTMKILGWGENLPKNAILEWRNWCMNKYYYLPALQQQLKTDKFYDFKQPITALYMSDDYIANDITAPLMIQFFPNASTNVIKLQVEEYTSEKVGHTNIFRKKFENTLWDYLIKLIEK